MIPYKFPTVVTASLHLNDASTIEVDHGDSGTVWVTVGFFSLYLKDPKTIDALIEALEKAKGFLPEAMLTQYEDDKHSAIECMEGHDRGGCPRCRSAE